MGEQMYTMKSELVGQTSVVSDDLIQSFKQKICERQHFTISELLCEFISTNVAHSSL
jgi:hypothetical protein